MSVIQYQDYVRKVKASNQDFKVDILRTQRKFLFSICNHHQLWATVTDYPEVAAIHTKVANSLQEIIDHYDQLLERYFLDNIKEILP